MDAPKQSGYPILDKMEQKGLPLTRQTYLALDKWESNPTLTAEEEATLPPQFRTSEIAHAAQGTSNS